MIWNATQGGPPVVDVPTLGGSLGYAYAINPSGTLVAGYSTTAAGTKHAFVWANGTMQDLGVLQGFTESVAQAVNGLHQVVGRSWQGGTYRGTGR